MDPIDLGEYFNPDTVIRNNYVNDDNSISFEEFNDQALITLHALWHSAKHYSNDIRKYIPSTYGFQCKYCPKIYKHEPSLRKHYFNTHTGIKLKCPMCLKDFVYSKIIEHCRNYETNCKHGTDNCEDREDDIPEDLMVHCSWLFDPPKELDYNQKWKSTNPTKLREKYREIMSRYRTIIPKPSTSTRLNNRNHMHLMNINFP